MADSTTPKDVDTMTLQEMHDELFACGAAIDGQWIPYPDETATRGFLKAVRSGIFDPATVTDDDRKRYMMKVAHVY